MSEITRQMKAPIFSAPGKGMSIGDAGRHLGKRVLRVLSKGSPVPENCWQYHVAVITAGIVLYITCALLVSNLFTEIRLP